MERAWTQEATKDKDSTFRRYIVDQGSRSASNKPEALTASALFALSNFTLCGFSVDNYSINESREKGLNLQRLT